MAQTHDPCPSVDSYGTSYYISTGRYGLFLDILSSTGGKELYLIEDLREDYTCVEGGPWPLRTYALTDGKLEEVRMDLGLEGVEEDVLLYKEEEGELAGRPYQEKILRICEDLEQHPSEIVGGFSLDDFLDSE